MIETERGKIRKHVILKLQSNYSYQNNSKLVSEKILLNRSGGRHHNGSNRAQNQFNTNWRQLNRHHFPTQYILVPNHNINYLQYISRCPPSHAYIQISYIFLLNDYNWPATHTQLPIACQISSFLHHGLVVNPSNVLLLKLICLHTKEQFLCPQQMHRKRYLLNRLMRPIEKEIIIIHG